MDQVSIKEKGSCRPRFVSIFWFLFVDSSSIPSKVGVIQRLIERSSVPDTQPRRKHKGLHAHMFKSFRVILLEAVQTCKHSYTHL